MKLKTITVTEEMVDQWRVARRVIHLPLGELLAFLDEAFSKAGNVIYFGGAE